VVSASVSVSLSMTISPKSLVPTSHFQCILLTAVAPLLSDGVAIGCVLPILSVASLLHIMIASIERQRVYLPST